MNRLAPGVALFLSLAWASSAQAGTYDVWSCAGPDRRPAPIAGWTPMSQGAPPPDNLCAQGRGLRGALQGLPAVAGSATGWSFEAPSGMTIASYELVRSARSGQPNAGGQRAYGLYHDQPIFDPTVFLFEYCVQSPQGCSAVGDPGAATPWDPDNVVVRRGLRIRRLIVRMECRGGDCAAATYPGDFTLSQARIGLADDAAPAIADVGGALVMPGAAVAGPQAVRVSASDVGGGLDRIEVVVDGAVVSTDRMGAQATTCRAPYVDLVPCPAAADAQLGVDTATLPNGTRTVQVAAVDVAGNRTLTQPVAITVENGSTPNGEGASRAVLLDAAFSRPRSGRSQRARVGFGATRAIAGRLLDQQRRPIAGARLEVMATQRSPGAKSKLEGVAITDLNGSFRYTPRRGPSRELAIAYRAFSLDRQPSAVARLSLAVRAGVRLHVVPRRTTSRGTIRFRGRLLGGPGRAGAQVALYAVGRTQRSRVPVSVLTADAKGRFRFRYRFVRTFAPFTYRFVARVERQRGYPYAPASSPVATVRVVR
jgi:hypothetical protein